MNQLIKKTNKYLSSFFKKPAHVAFAVSIFLFFIVSLVMILGIFNISHNIRSYGADISEMYSSFSRMDSIISNSISSRKASELLMENTNKILTAVYFGTADEGDKKEARDFTAFSIMYKNKFFLITAGHCIEMDGIKYNNFKFKSNKNSRWIEPKLVDFNNDYENNLDYAIFYSENLIRTGLIPASENEDLTPRYVLGNLENGLNLIKKYTDAKKGESGSPVLNSGCHVIGVTIKKDGSYTPISAVLSAIENTEIAD